MSKDEDAWEIVRVELARMKKELDERPKFITLTRWQRLFHRHSMMFDGWSGFRYIERCECGYGRIDNGSWFKF